MASRATKSIRLARGAAAADVVDSTVVEPLANVIGDVIVEFRRDGTVVRRIPLLDVLDPYRVSYDSLGAYWDEHYGVTTRDWSHANALAFDAANDAWLVSLRHQDAIVQVRRNGSLGWILGDPARWRAPWSWYLLSAPGGHAWQYHQHAVQLMPDGTLLGFRPESFFPAELVADESGRATMRFHVSRVEHLGGERHVYGTLPGIAEETRVIARLPFTVEAHLDAGETYEFAIAPDRVGRA